MRISGNKRSFWVYLGLILMLVSLVLFSVLPLVTTIVKERRNPNSVTASVNPQLEQEALGYELVLEREPDNQTALRGLLNIRLQQGDLQGIIAPLSRLGQLNPDILEYQLLLAQTQAQIGDESGMATTYRNALERDPGNPVILKSWTDHLLTQNRPQEAISLVKQALNQKNTPKTIPLQLLLGEIYTHQGQTEEAIALYNQAIIRDNQDFRPVLAKALLLKQQGTSEEVESLFQQAIELAPVQYKDPIKELATQTLKSQS